VPGNVGRLRVFAAAVIDDATLGADERRSRDLMQRPETIELIRCYYAVADPQVRQQFLDLVKAMANG